MTKINTPPMFYLDYTVDAFSFFYEILDKLRSVSGYIKLRINFCVHYMFLSRGFTQEGSCNQAMCGVRCMCGVCMYVCVSVPGISCAFWISHFYHLPRDTASIVSHGPVIWLVMMTPGLWLVVWWCQVGCDWLAVMSCHVVPPPHPLHFFRNSPSLL